MAVTPSPAVTSGKLELEGVTDAPLPELRAINLPLSPREQNAVMHIIATANSDGHMRPERADSEIASYLVDRILRLRQQDGPIIEAKKLTPALRDKIGNDMRRHGAKAVVTALRDSLTGRTVDAEPVKVKAHSETAAVLSVILEHWR